MDLVWTDYIILGFDTYVVEFKPDQGTRLANAALSGKSVTVRDRISLISLGSCCSAPPPFFWTDPGRHVWQLPFYGKLQRPCLFGLLINLRSLRRWGPLARTALTGTSYDLKVRRFLYGVPRKEEPLLKESHRRFVLFPINTTRCAWFHMCYPFSSS